MPQLPAGRVLGRGGKRGAIEPVRWSDGNGWCRFSILVPILILIVLK